MHLINAYCMDMAFCNQATWLTSLFSMDGVGVAPSSSFDVADAYTL